jgi:hypothetical protein
VLGLIGKRGRRERLAHVVRLHELRIGPNLADGAHGQNGRLALVHEDLEESLVARPMRIPMAVKPREPRRRERLVDRSVEIEMRVTLRHIGGMTRQKLGPGRIEHMGVTRAAAMMTQARNGADAKRLEALQARIVPGEVRTVRALGRDCLPEHRMPQRADPEFGNAVEILDSIMMTGL